MRTIETQLYKFEELTEEAQQKAIETPRNCEFYLDYEWYDSVYENQTEIIKNAGFNLTKIYFTGFWSQGDGTMFEYSSINSKLFNEFVETLTDLSSMRKNWLKTQSYITAKGSHYGHYCHEKSCTHTIYLESDFSYHLAENFSEWIYSFQQEFESFIENKYIDLCETLYKALETEYDYLMSDEAIKEHLIVNEYEFEADGKIF